MAEAYETNQVSFPQMTPFGVAYQEYIRKSQDPAAGVAQAKQNELDAGRGSKNIVRGKIIRTEWSDPEQMTVTEPEIPIRKATSEENKQFAEEMGKPFAILGAAATAAAFAASKTPLLARFSAPLYGGGRVLGSAGTLISTTGGWVGDQAGRLTVDMERVPKRMQEPHDKYEGSSQDDPANMIY